MDKAKANAEQEKKITPKKVLTNVVNVLIWIFVAFSAVVVILAFLANTNGDGVPAIGGKAILTVLTPSMEPGQYEGAPKYADKAELDGVTVYGSFYQGDILISDMVPATDQKSMKLGEIISYKAGDLNNDGISDINSHRIVGIGYNVDGYEIEVKRLDNGDLVYRKNQVDYEYAGEKLSEENVVYYLTKGDHNQGVDVNNVTPEQVICKYNGFRIPKLGSLLGLLQSRWGFLLCIVLPLVLFFVYELVMFIVKFLKVKNADKKQITAADEELIRQRAVEEYIRSQQAEAGTGPSPEPEADQGGEAAPEAASAPETETETDARDAASEKKEEE